MALCISTSHATCTGGCCSSTGHIAQPVPPRADTRVLSFYWCTDARAPSSLFIGRVSWYKSASGQHFECTFSATILVYIPQNGHTFAVDAMLSSCVSRSCHGTSHCHLSWVEGQSHASCRWWQSIITTWYWWLSVSAKEEEVDESPAFHSIRSIWSREQKRYSAACRIYGMLQCELLVFAYVNIYGIRSASASMLSLSLASMITNIWTPSSVLSVKKKSKHTHKIFWTVQWLPPRNSCWTVLVTEIPSLTRMQSLSSPKTSSTRSRTIFGTCLPTYLSSIALSTPSKLHSKPTFHILKLVTERSWLHQTKTLSKQNRWLTSSYRSLLVVQEKLGYVHNDFAFPLSD